MNNTLVISRPTRDAMSSAQCPSTCNTNLGPADPLDKGKLGPRKKREQVREQVKDYVMLMLGAPVVKLEIDTQNLDFAVDQAMKVFEEYAGREYFSYYTFFTSPGKSVYEMPPDVGLVRNIYYNTQPNFGFQSADLGGSVPLEYYYGNSAYGSILGMLDPTQPIWGRAGEWTIYRQYSEMHSRLSSHIGGWEWVGDQKHIILHPVPFRSSKVIVHYMQRSKDWDNVPEAIQEGALAYTKIMLGRIRGKYKNLPGPNGGIQNDGDQLSQEGREDLEKWRELLITRWGELPAITMY